MGEKLTRVEWEVIIKEVPPFRFIANATTHHKAKSQARRAWGKKYLRDKEAIEFESVERIEAGRGQ